MSLEYFGFSKDTSPIPIERLSDQFRRHGMRLRILRGFQRWSDSQVVLAGDLLSGDAICGWQLSHSSADAIESAFVHLDWPSLERFTEAGALAACELEIWDSPSAYNESLADEAQNYSAGYSVYRAASSVRYYIRTAAGRTELAARLQVFVLERILELRGGMFEDPQEAQFKIISAI